MRLREGLRQQSAEYGNRNGPPAASWFDHGFAHRDEGDRWPPQPQHGPVVLPPDADQGRGKPRGYIEISPKEVFQSIHGTPVLKRRRGCWQLDHLNRANAAALNLNPVTRISGESAHVTQSARGWGG